MFDQVAENEELQVCLINLLYSKPKETNMNKGQLIEAVQKNLGKDTTKAAADAAVNAVINAITKWSKRNQFKSSDSVPLRRLLARLVPALTLKILLDPKLRSRLPNQSPSKLVPNSRQPSDFSSTYPFIKNPWFPRVFLYNMKKEDYKMAFVEDTRDWCFSFAPGRIEFLGNHLDYNGGDVLGMAVNAGIYCLGVPDSENMPDGNTKNQESIFSFQ